MSVCHLLLKIEGLQAIRTLLHQNVRRNLATYQTAELIDKISFSPHKEMQTARIMKE